LTIITSKLVSDFDPILIVFIYKIILFRSFTTILKSAEGYFYIFINLYLTHNQLDIFFIEYVITRDGYQKSKLNSLLIQSFET